MSASTIACVVDASVGIKLFIDEADSDEADALFAGLAASPPTRLYVPDLFFIECANILWKHVRRFGYPADAAAEAIADLVALGMRSVATADLAETALGLALAHDITAYDACYVALAAELHLPLVTADERLAQTLAGSACQVHQLGRGLQALSLLTLA